MQTVVKSRAAKRLKISPATLCPFLYQTRTITNQRTRLPTSSDQSHQDEDTTLTFLQRKARDVEARREATESTITPSEREIFTNIMKNFGAKVDGIGFPPQPSSSESEQHQKSQPVRQKPEPLPLQQLEPASTHVTNTNVDDILSIFAPAETNERFSAFSNSTDGSSSDPEIDYTTSSSRSNPRNIRHAAMQSLQHISTNFKDALSSTTIPPDLALWRILETEIFPLMTLMQTHRSPPNVNPYQQTLSSLPIDILPISISSLPPETPFLPLITILYPAATLFALRTYIAHLPASGFVPALLPKIRSLGPASYLLAGNTHFFNAAMYVQWTVYSDLRGVFMLLSEMRRTGVEYDQVTLNLIEEISAQREEDTDEANKVDSRARDWWGMKRQEEWWRKLERKYRFDILKEGRRGSKSEDHEREIDREIR